MFAMVKSCIYEKADADFSIMVKGCSFVKLGRWTPLQADGLRAAWTPAST